MSGPSADSSQSKSTQFRVRGNDLLKTLHEDLAPVLKKSRTDKIKESYRLALEYAENKSEEASAHKNLSALHSRLAAGTTEAWQKLLHWLDALLENILASNLARNMSKEWTESVLESRAILIEYLRMVSNELPVDQELAWIKKWNQALADLGGPKVKRGELAYENGKHLLHRCITCMDKAGPPEYAIALTYIIEANCAVEVAKKLLLGRQWRSELADLIEDLNKHRSICESGKARVQADKRLQQCLMGSESLDMDEVWAVADLLKHAIIITRELDIESEAMALSRLGRLHYDVTKKEDKAVACLKQGLLLAQSLHPIPMQKAWYEDIVNTLAKLQHAITARHDAEWQRKREPILKELKDDLDALSRLSNKSIKEFLTHLYKHHPPKDPTHTQPEHDPEAQKKILKTAISHYHPDKAAHADDKWYVLCEEILKLLNQKYVMFK